MNAIDPRDLNDALQAMTNLMLRTLESKDNGRRLATVCDIARTAQQLIRSTSMRVEDFDDPRRLAQSIRANMQAKGMGSDRMKPVLVPTDLTSEASAALAAIEITIAATLYGDKPQRFAEVDRLAVVAQLLIQAVEEPKPPASKRSKDGGDVAFLCGTLRDDEEYAMDEGGPPDQLQRDYIETQSDARRSTVAAAEAAELASLLQLLDDPRDKHDLGDAARARVAHLKKRLATRTQGLKENADAVVHSDVSRRHQPDREGTGDDHRPGLQADAQREQGNGQPAGARPGVPVGVEAVVHA